MLVRLISYTRPAIAIADEGIHNCQELIAFCARVSNPSNQLNTETSEKLLRYMMKHKHWSPFEMASVCLEITSTRDIIRQILRHRSFSFQEFSQRYADPTKALNFVKREVRLQDPKNRQNSISPDNDIVVPLSIAWENEQKKVMEAALSAYEWAIEQGIAKEVARAVLPEGLTESKVYMQGSIRSWMHYVQVRTDPSTQKEHREIAEACLIEIGKILPMILKEQSHEIKKE